MEALPDELNINWAEGPRQSFRKAKGLSETMLNIEPDAGSRLPQPEKNKIK